MVECRSVLIDPELEFSAHNIMVHGITPAMVRDAPNFARIWPQLAALLEGNIVVAHNASFDMSVLQRAAWRYGIEDWPEFEYGCTYRLSKEVWPGLASYSLGQLAPALGISFRHHEADEDARACAELATTMIETAGVKGLRQLSAKVGRPLSRSLPVVSAP